jgi:hypothetical protein
MAETVTLEFVARQLERVLAEQAATRDDLRGLTSIVLRHEMMITRFEDTMRATLEQIRAMVAQHRHFDIRLRPLRKRSRPERTRCGG